MHALELILTQLIMKTKYLDTSIKRLHNIYINYATKYSTKMNAKFSCCNQIKSSVINLNLNQEN